MKRFLKVLQDYIINVVIKAIERALETDLNEDGVIGGDK